MDDEEWIPCLTLELRRNDFDAQRVEALLPEYWLPYGLTIDSATARLLTRWMKASDDDNWKITANAVLIALRSDMERRTSSAR